MRYELRSDEAHVTIEADDESIDLHAVGAYRDEPATLTAGDARNLAHQLIKAAELFGGDR